MVEGKCIFPYFSCFVVNSLGFFVPLSLHGVPEGRIYYLVHLITLRNLGAGGDLEERAGASAWVGAESIIPLKNRYESTDIARDILLKAQGWQEVNHR